MRGIFEAFIRQRKAKTTKSTFWDRFRFLKTEEPRSRNLQRLQTWNKDMERFTDNACKAAKRRPAPTAATQYHSSYLRELSQRLFAAFSQRWNCQCNPSHQARFHLASCYRLRPEAELRRTGTFFEFLVSHLHRQGHEVAPRRQSHHHCAAASFTADPCISRSVSATSNATLTTYDTLAFVIAQSETSQIRSRVRSVIL